MSEVSAMPMFWTEKLFLLQNGEHINLTKDDKIGTVSMAKVRIEKKTAMSFKIRTNKKTGVTGIWRIK